MNTIPPRRPPCMQLPAREAPALDREWGYIQATDLRRSEEILTGAIPSAKNGTIVVETTWRG